MNIVVTGASKGIGREIVKLLGNNPEHHIYALSRDFEKLTSLKKQCLFPDNIHIYEVDLSKEIPHTLFEKEVMKLDKIDILINNAGSLIHKSFLEMNQKEWKSIYETNVFSVAKLIKKLYPQLLKSETAHIVNIGSMGGVENSMKFPGLAAYSSSKAALANLTQCLAEEFKGTSIHCNCLCLGAVQTEMLEEAFPGYKAPTTSKEMAEFIIHFSLHQRALFNGKIIQVASTTP